jgi:hypothetical protein
VSNEKALIISIPTLNGSPELLFCEQLCEALQELGVVMPVDRLLDASGKLFHDTTVMIGVSGCGKTKTCFDICSRVFAIYFDCSSDQDFLQACNILNLSKPTIHSLETQELFEDFSRHQLLSLIAARLLVLKNLPHTTPRQWLLIQRSGRTRAFFDKVYLEISKLTPKDLFKLVQGLRHDIDPLLIFDEAQCLLDELPTSYRSLKDKSIVDGKIQSPRSLFSFMTSTITKLNFNSILAGTHMRISSIEAVHSAAFGKTTTIKVFTDFNYLLADHIGYLAKICFSSEVVNNSELLERMKYFLQGRPRIFAHFLKKVFLLEQEQLASESITRFISSCLDKYICSLTTKQPLDHTTEFSPYHFWSQRARVSITDFDQPLPLLGKDRIVFDLLVKLCLYHLFQDEEGFYLVDDIDLVSTSLVMILYNETGWYCKIAEPIIIYAGLNFLKDSSTMALSNYFARALFSPLKATLGLSPQDRGHLMELFIVLRTLQSWWLEERIQPFLPQWVKDASIPQPAGVLDQRNSSDTPLLLQMLRESDFPFICLPPRHAGPDILFSIFAIHVRTTWKLSKSVHVSKQECDSNGVHCDSHSWYSSAPKIHQECLQALQSRNGDFFHLRIELPYPHPSVDLHSEGNSLHINLGNLTLAEAFFGRYFVQKYLNFLEHMKNH